MSLYIHMKVIAFAAHRKLYVNEQIHKVSLDPHNVLSVSFNMMDSSKGVKQDAQCKQQNLVKTVKEIEQSCHNQEMCQQDEESEGKENEFIEKGQEAHINRLTLPQ